MPHIIDPNPQILDRHGYPIQSVAEMADEITGLSYREAAEVLRIFADQMGGSTRGIFSGEDSGWKEIDASSGESTRDALTLEQVQEAGRLGYLYWTNNPNVHQGVETTSEYVFGRGFSITSEDEDVRNRARDLWAESDVQEELAGGKKMQEHCSLGQVFGNLFFTLTPKPSEDDRIHTVPLSTITNLYVDQWDKPIMWLRSYHEMGNPDEPKYEWVKSLKYWDRPVQPPDWLENDYPINDEYAMHHISMGSLVGPLGLPTFWSSVPWAKAYKESLEDFAVVSRALRTFAWRATGSGFDGVQNMRQAVQSGFQAANNSPMGTGRAIFMPTNDSAFQPIRTANYQTPADGSRRLLLMACSGFGLPETYFGDVSVGTYATAATMERPVELRMKAIQEMWKFELERMLSFLLDGNTKNQKKIKIKFPSILEHDAGPYMQAVKAADELSYPTMTPELMAEIVLETLGVEEIEDMVKKMKDQHMFDISRQEEMLQMQAEYAPDPMAGGPGGEGRKADQLGKDRQRADRPKGAGMPRPDRS